MLVIHIDDRLDKDALPLNESSLTVIQILRYRMLKYRMLKYGMVRLGPGYLSFKLLFLAFICIFQTLQSFLWRGCGSEGRYRVREVR